MALRNHRGQFKRGISGNPGGRPKGANRLKFLARAKTTIAINALTEILKSSKAKDSDKISAAHELLNRAWGKPQNMENSNESAMQAPTYFIMDDPKFEEQKRLNEQKALNGAEPKKLFE